MKNKIEWKTDGWTCVQEADAAKHVLEINCFAEGGIVKELRIRHNDGELAKGVIYRGDEKVALPMAFSEFREQYEKGELTFK